MRLLLAVAVAICGSAVAPMAGWPARAVPGECPPICDGIPDSAWIASTSIPLYPAYRWPGLAGLAVELPAFSLSQPIRVLQPMCLIFPFLCRRPTETSGR